MASFRTLRVSPPVAGLFRGLGDSLGSTELPEPRKPFASARLPLIRAVSPPTVMPAAPFPEAVEDRTLAASLLKKSTPPPPFPDTVED